MSLTLRFIFLSRYFAIFEYQSWHAEILRRRVSWEEKRECLDGQKAKRAVEAAGKSNRCFSIIAASRSLDLECANVEERDVWMRCKKKPTLDDIISRFERTLTLIFLFFNIVYFTFNIGFSEFVQYARLETPEDMRKSSKKF